MPIAVGKATVGIPSYFYGFIITIFERHPKVDLTGLDFVHCRLLCFTHLAVAVTLFNGTISRSGTACW